MPRTSTARIPTSRRDRRGARRVRGGGGPGRDRAAEPVVRLALRAGPRGARAGRQGPARPGPRRAGEGGARGARRDLRPPAGRRLGAARLAREPAAPGRPRPRSDRHRDRGRRARALHLVPPDRARALPRRRRRGLRHRRARGALPHLRRHLGRAVAGPGRPRPSASAGCSASGPTTTRCATWRRRPWATRRSCGSPRWTATARPPTAVTERRLRLLFGDRDVDRRAAPAADAHLLRHVRRRPSPPRARCRTARRRSRRARCRGTRAGRRPPGSPSRRRAAPRPRGSGASRSSPSAVRQSFPSFPAKSATSASSTPATTPSPIDAALPVICALVWIVPPPS